MGRGFLIERTAAALSVFRPVLRPERVVRTSSGPSFTKKELQRLSELSGGEKKRYVRELRRKQWGC